MKKILLILLLVSGLSLKADPPQLIWRMSNPRIIKSTQQRFEFDIEVKANQNGSYYSSGQCMFYFNNYAISSTSNLHWTIIPAGISAQTHPDIGNKYIISRVLSGTYPGVKVLVALSPTDEAVLDEIPSSGYLAEITTEWQTFVRVQCRITDPSADAEINFYPEGTNGQNFYLSAPGIESSYQNPSLYNSLTLASASLARIYCTIHGWSQYGGATDNEQFLDWTSSVNTSVWEGNAVGDGNNCNAQNLHIHSGASMQITDQTNLTVSGMIMNETGNTGLKLLSSAAGTASLIHNNNHVGATVQRYITGNANLEQQAYHCVSVPIEFSATSGLFLNSYLYRFDSPTQSWQAMGTATDTPLDTHEGFLIYYPNSNITYEFPGMLNNDMFPLNVSYHSANGFTGLNLVPNPYPSAIDWSNEAGWMKFNINDAIWIWNPQLKNYATYGSGVGTNNATQYIPSGQSFFVKANADGPVLQVNNSARLHHDQSFFKRADESNLMRVKAIANDLQDEIVIRFRENGSDNYDQSEDIDKMFGGDVSPQLYSVLPDNTELSVNTLSFPDSPYTIPVSFELGLNTEATLNFENIASLSDFSAIMLEDLIINSLTDIRIQPIYVFAHDTTNASERFLLHFQHITSAGENPAHSHHIWGFKDKIYFTVPECHGEKLLVEIHDLTGRIAHQRVMYAASINSLTITGFNGSAFVSILSESRTYIGKVLIIR